MARTPQNEVIDFVLHDPRHHSVALRDAVVMLDRHRVVPLDDDQFPRHREASLRHPIGAARPSDDLRIDEGEDGRLRLCDDDSLRNADLRSGKAQAAFGEQSEFHSRDRLVRRECFRGPRDGRENWIWMSEDHFPT